MAPGFTNGLIALIFVVLAPAGVIGAGEHHVHSNSFNKAGSKNVKPGLQKVASILLGCPGLDVGDVNVSCHHEKFEKRFGSGLDCSSKVPLKTKAMFLNCPTGYGIIEEYTVITCKFPGRWDNDIFTCDETTTVTTPKKLNATTVKANTTVTRGRLNTTTTTKPINGTTKRSTLSTKPLTTNLTTLPGNGSTTAASITTTAMASGTNTTLAPANVVTTHAATLATQATVAVETTPASGVTSPAATTAAATTAAATTAAATTAAATTAAATTAAATTAAATTAAATTAAATTTTATTTTATTAAGTTTTTTTTTETAAASTTAAGTTTTTTPLPIADTSYPTSQTTFNGTTFSFSVTENGMPTTTGTMSSTSTTGTTVTTTAAPCNPSSGFDKCFGGKIYRVEGHTWTWDEAYNDCKKDNGNLPVIETQAELDFILSINNGDHLYVGYNDKATEGTFITVDGSPLPTLFPIQNTAASTAESYDCVKYGPTANSYSPKIGMLDISCTFKIDRQIVCEKQR